jgi:hypothetical protein
LGVLSNQRINELRKARQFAFDSVNWGW